MTATARADEELQRVLDREAASHEAAARRARQQRRAVWLRLHEEAGYTYEKLSALSGYGATTLLKEIRRARSERDDDQS